MARIAVVDSGDRQARQQAAAGEPRYGQVLAEFRRQAAEAVPKLVVATLARIAEGLAPA
jgi:hypothetical protein